MRVAVRVDASNRIGTGHLRRCLSLLSALTALGAETCVVLRRHDSVAINVMEATGVAVRWLAEPQSDFDPEDGNGVAHAAWAGVSWQQDAADTVAALDGFAPDWLIVDHYSFDSRWHDAVRTGLDCRMLAIDDLGDRPLSVDILLDANASHDHAGKYAGQLRRKARMLTGLRFALLSPIYRTAPVYEFCDDVRSIGVFMGGADPDGISAQVLTSLREEAGFAGPVEIVSSAANGETEKLARICEQDGQATLSADLPDLSAFYARHDLQIGAGGTSSYERCCIGVPSVGIAIAKNQLTVIPFLEEMGTMRSAILPTVKETQLLSNAPSLSVVVSELIADPGQRRLLSTKSRASIDAFGAERVALSMLLGTMTIRPAAMTDGALLHAWRNHPATRSMSINSDEIALADHLEWLEATIANPSRALFLALIGGRPIGSVRFDMIENNDWLVSLYLDPDLHGLGLGKQMLLLGEGAITKRATADFAFRAEVAAENSASASLFASAGYCGGPTEYSKSFRVERNQ